MKTNVYDLLYKSIAQSGKSVLLHACCAPCASVCFEVLSAAGGLTNIVDNVADSVVASATAGGLVDTAVNAAAGISANTSEDWAAGIKTAAYFFNPNIMPHDEYERRGDELERLCAVAGVKLIVGEYNNAEFLEMVRGMEGIKEGGERCELCYEMRLFETATAAKRMGFDYFATSLTLSPHKNAEVINSIGFKVAEKVGVEYLPSDFKKRGGYLRSVELSRQYGFYRQSYCGCAFGDKR